MSVGVPVNPSSNSQLPAAPRTTTRRRVADPQEDQCHVSTRGGNAVVYVPDDEEEATSCSLGGGGGGLSLCCSRTECCERLAYYGMSTNLVNYIEKHLSMGNVAASNSVTNWSGTCYATPLIGAFLADAYLGRYWTIASFVVVYICGMTLLTLSASVPGLTSSCNGEELHDAIDAISFGSWSNTTLFICKHLELQFLQQLQLYVL